MDQTVKKTPASKTCGLIAAAVLFAAGCATNAPLVTEPDLFPSFDGHNLAGWHIADKYDFEDHGRVHVQDGALILERGNPMTGVSWTGPVPKTNYEVTLEAKRVEGDDFFGSITFPVGDSWCTLIIGGWGGMVVGLSNIDRMNASENETTQLLIFETGRWYPIRLRVTGDAIRAWINDDPVIDLERENHEFDIWWEQHPMKPFGFNTWRTTGALRSIAVRGVSPDEPASRD